jgi:acetyl esterase/lipase
VLRRLVILAVLLGLVVVLVRPLRVGAQAAMLIPSLMEWSVRPLEWVSDEPVVEAVPYRGPGSADLADLWLPAGASRERPVGGVLLVLGVNNVGRGHPAVTRVAEALARSGMAVLVPDSAVLMEGRLEPAEIDGVVRAFEALGARAEVDPERVGMVGVSAGGSLALLAAADARIADRIAYVNAFGAYADARAYIASLAAHAYELDGATVEWTPTRLALEGFPRLVLGHVPDPADRRLLQDALLDRLAAGERPMPDAALWERLGPEGRAFYRLLVAGTLSEARAAVEALPAQTLPVLDELSPIRALDRLRAPIHLMHERDDDLVPFVESRKLAAGLAPGGRLVRHTEFRLFTHVQPDTLDPLAATPELWKLLWHVQALMLEAV